MSEIAWLHQLRSTEVTCEAPGYAIERYSGEFCDLGKANTTSTSIPCRSGPKSIRHHRSSYALA
jgi:hypothetical protein